jgi:hypothetical protein
MFEMIRHPILSIRGILVVARSMTPEQRAEYRTATDARKEEIVNEILAERFGIVA